MVRAYDRKKKNNTAKYHTDESQTGERMVYLEICKYISCANVQGPVWQEVSWKGERGPDQKALNASLRNLDFILKGDFNHVPKMSKCLYWKDEFGSDVENG